MRHTFLLLTIGICLGVAIASQKKQDVAVDPVDMIIEKSNQTMKKATAVSAKADKQVSAKISEMKQTIEVLVEEKEQLVEQVKVMENEIISIKSAPVQPFDVLAIGVPDSASGGK